MEKEDEFIRYPTDTLFGIVDQPGDAKQVLQALTAAGFTEDKVRVFCGESGARQIDSSGVQHGVLTQLVRLYQRTTVERDHAEQYEQALHQGSYVIAIHISDSVAREQAEQILGEHGGHFINFYGRHTIRKLKS